MDPVSHAAITPGEAVWPEGAPRPWDMRAWLRGPLVAALLLAAVVALAWALRTIVVLVLVAETVAYIVEPLVRRVERRGVSRTWVALVVGLLVLGLEVLLVGWLAPQVAREGMALARALPDAAERLAERVDLGALLERVQEASGGIGGHAVDVARTAVGWTASALGLSVLFPVLVALLVVHFPAAARALDYVPRQRRPQVERLLDDLDGAVGGFFRGRVLISAIVAALLALGWWLCGVPHALALGLLGGLLNLVPFASTLAWAVALLLGYAEADHGSWVSILVWPTVVFAAVNVLENSVLTPWIQSRAVDLSALGIMLATLAGGSLFGAIGLFYAIPVAASLKTLLREAGLPRLRAWAEAH